MKLHLNDLKTAAAATLIAILAGCGGGSEDPAAAPARLQSLHVVGGSYVTQTTFVLDITSRELKYVNLQFGKAVIDHVGPISPEDFQRLAALVESANLTQTLGQRTGRSAPCRNNDVEISITTDKAKHDFVVPGAETCGGASSPAYVQLSTLYSELVVKYVYPAVP